MALAISTNASTDLQASMASGKRAMVVEKPLIIHKVKRDYFALRVTGGVISDHPFAP
jgi:hypothetical protein